MNTNCETAHVGGGMTRVVRRAIGHVEIVLIPGATFDMGAADGAAAEAPVHAVTLDPFWMGKTHVTNAQFAHFVKEAGYTTDAERAGQGWGRVGGKYAMIPSLSWRSFAEGRDDHPVVLVSWNDAVAFCCWAGGRLPTEAEWEYVASADARRDTPPLISQLPGDTTAHFGLAWDNELPTRPTVSSSPNTLGVHDIVGNAWQWCADYFDPSYYACAPLTNPTGPTSGKTRVRRGGSWNVIQAFRLRSSNRGAMDPGASAPNVGFRMVVGL